MEMYEKNRIQLDGKSDSLNTHYRLYQTYQEYVFNLDNYYDKLKLNVF